MVCCKHHHLPLSLNWKPLSPPLFPDLNDIFNTKKNHPMVLTMSRSSSVGSLSDENDAGTGIGVPKGKGSGTTARGRRLLKLREEKRKREYDRLHNYPAWAKCLSILFYSNFFFWLTTLSFFFFFQF